MLLLSITLAFACFFALVGAYISAQKDRPPFEGFLLGFLLGPLGLLIAVLLPTRARPPVLAPRRTQSRAVRSYRDREIGNFLADLTGEPREVINLEEIAAAEEERRRKAWEN